MTLHKGESPYWLQAMYLSNNLTVSIGRAQTGSSSTYAAASRLQPLLIYVVLSARSGRLPQYIAAPLQDGILPQHHPFSSPQGQQLQQLTSCG